MSKIIETKSYGQFITRDAFVCLNKINDVVFSYQILFRVSFFFGKF